MGSSTIGTTPPVTPPAKPPLGATPSNPAEQNEKNKRDEEAQRRREIEAKSFNERNGRINFIRVEDYTAEQAKIDGAKKNENGSGGLTLSGYGPADKLDNGFYRRRGKEIKTVFEDWNYAVVDGSVRAIPPPKGGILGLGWGNVREAYDEMIKLQGQSGASTMTFSWPDTTNKDTLLKEMHICLDLCEKNGVVCDFGDTAKLQAIFNNAGRQGKRFSADQQREILERIEAVKNKVAPFKLESSEILKDKELTRELKKDAKLTGKDNDEKEANLKKDLFKSDDTDASKHIKDPAARMEAVNKELTNLDKRMDKVVEASKRIADREEQLEQKQKNMDPKTYDHVKKMGATDITALKTALQEEKADILNRKDILQKVSQDVKADYDKSLAAKKTAAPVSATTATPAAVSGAAVATPPTTTAAAVKGYDKVPDISAPAALAGSMGTEYATPPSLGTTATIPATPASTTTAGAAASPSAAAASTPPAAAAPASTKPVATSTAAAPAAPSTAAASTSTTINASTPSTPEEAAALEKMKELFEKNAQLLSSLANKSEGVEKNQSALAAKAAASKQEQTPEPPSMRR